MNIAKSGKELINICQKEQISLSEYAIRKEVEAKGVSREELFLQMKNTLNAMKESATLGERKRCILLVDLLAEMLIVYNNIAILVNP